MDLHRSRFIPYPMSPINALAFSHSSGEELFEHNQDDLKLAVGRGNGDIEIWSPARGAWVQETVFHGGKDRSVEGLAWTQEPPEVDKKGNPTPGALRLFSIGYSSTVTEWDLATGLPLRNSTGNYSEVWCVAAQPRWTPTVLDAGGKQVEREGEWQAQNLAIGCADGTLAILSTADNDLQFLKFLARQTEKRARVLSLTWRDLNTVVAGFANSSIGIYDMQRSSCIRTITLGAAPKTGPKDILVWAVKSLPNGDLISGDSTGEVRFFDGKQYSQYQRLVGHDADLLDLAVSADGETIWSAGMDRKTAVYTRAKKGPSGRGTWYRNQVKTYHDHDVKAMATFEFGGKQKKMSVIASGGIDANLVIIPMRGFWTENHRTISGLPQQPALVSAPRARIVVSWWERELSLWKIPVRDTEVKPYKCLSRIALKGDENITSAAITEDGALIAAASAISARLFRRVALLGGRTLLKQIHSEALSIGARHIQFSPDGKWLALITHTNEVQVARILYQDHKPFIRVVPGLIPLELQRKRRIKDRYAQTLTRLQFSPTSQMLVASDLAGRIHSWLLTGAEDRKAMELDVPEPSTASDASDRDSDSSSEPPQVDLPVKTLNQHWAANPAAATLPRLPSAPILLSFRPSRPDHLVVVSAQHQLYEFDVARGRLSEWSARNASARLPERFSALLDRAMGCVWHAYPNTGTERLWLYGSGWVFMLDLARDFDGSGGEEREVGRGKKRKRAGQSGAGDESRREEFRGLKVEEKVNRRRKSTLVDGANGVDGGDSEMEVGEEGKGKVPLEQRITKMTDEEVAEAAKVEAESKKTKKDERWWFTFKYRPILGMVPIGDPESRGKKQKKSVEVLLVERPVWDLDLPERFTANYDR